MKETELAAKVVEWLQAQHWDVYQEVQPHHFGSTADIVGRNGSLLWVVEVKKSLSLALLEQVLRWQGRANYISIATPRPKRHTRGDDAARFFLRHFGIGKIEIRQRRIDNVDQIVAPRLCRRRIGSLMESLTEHHKTYAQAGNADGRRWTPFRNTCMELQRIVQAQPGIHLKAAIDKTSHHYNSDSTARACIAKYLQMEGVVKGVKAVREGRHLKLYPKPE